MQSHIVGEVFFLLLWVVHLPADIFLGLNFWCVGHRTWWVLDCNCNNRVPEDDLWENPSGSHKNHQVGRCHRRLRMLVLSLYLLSFDKPFADNSELLPDYSGSRRHSSDWLMYGYLHWIVVVRCCVLRIVCIDRYSVS